MCVSVCFIYSFIICIHKSITDEVIAVSKVVSFFGGSFMDFLIQLEWPVSKELSCERWLCLFFFISFQSPSLLFIFCSFSLPRHLAFFFFLCKLAFFYYVHLSFIFLLFTPFLFNSLQPSSFSTYKVKKKKESLTVFFCVFFYF